MPRKYRTARIRSLCNAAIDRCLARIDIYLELGYVRLARPWYRAYLALWLYLNRPSCTPQDIDQLLQDWDDWDEQHILAHEER